MDNIPNLDEINYNPVSDGSIHNEHHTTGHGNISSRMLFKTLVANEHYQLSLGLTIKTTFKM